MVAATTARIIAVAQVLVCVCVRARACNYDQCVHHRNWLRHVCVRVGVSVGKMRSCLAGFYTR